jgi:predicted GNAT family acetyltransferase
MPGALRSFPMTFTDNSSANRFELQVDGRVAAVASYVLAPGKIVLNYTELMPGFEGRGLGQILANAVLDDVRLRGLRLAAKCPFFSTFIEDHPEYADLIDRSPEPSNSSIG